MNHILAAFTIVFSLIYVLLLISDYVRRENDKYEDGDE